MNPKTKIHFDVAMRALNCNDLITAASRMYYSVLHTMCDSLYVLKGINRDGRNNHTGVRKDFAEAFRLSKNMVIQIELWKKVRENADYERRIASCLEDSEILSAIQSMQVFIKQQQEQQKRQIDRMYLF